MRNSSPGREALSPLSIRSDFKIGDAVVKPGLNQVVFSDRVDRVELKTMQVLLALISQPGVTMSRGQLLARVWPDAFVGEDVLNRAIYRLRKVLKDDPKKPRYIETVPKVGYRWVAAVEPIANAVATAVNPESTPGARAPSAIGMAPRRPRFKLLVAAAALALFPAAIALTLRPSTPATGQRARVVPLLAMPGHQTTPRLSPDGSRIAYTEEEAAGGASGIRVQLVSGGAPLRLTSGFRDTAPVWSPSGAELIWFRYADDGSCELRRASYLGGDETRLAACPAGADPPLAWSPDGQKLAFCAMQPGLLASRIWELTIDSGRLEPVTTPPQDFIGDGRPMYSPDGRWLAFVRNTVLGAADVHVLDRETGGVRQLTHDGFAVPGLDFTPDSEHLVFLSPRGGDIGLWKVPITRGDIQWVGFSRPSLGQLTVAAAGNRMAVTSNTIVSSIWERPVHSSGTATATRLIASSRYDHGAEASPDGQRIAWVSDRSGNPEVWLASAAGTEVGRVTDIGGAQVGPPRWSPDSKHLLFEVRQRDSADLFVLEVGTRTPRKMPSPESQELAPRWSADGQSILFASSRSGRWQVWRRSTAGGDAEQITDHGGFAAIEAADGTLFYTKMTESGIWMRSAGGHTERQLISDLPVSDWTNWTLTPGGVIYMRRPPFGRGNAELLLVEISTGAVARLADLGLIDARSSITFSPVGDRVLYGRNDRVDADIYLLDQLL